MLHLQSGLRGRRKSRRGLHGELTGGLQVPCGGLESASQFDAIPLGSADWAGLKECVRFLNLRNDSAAWRLRNCPRLSRPAEAPWPHAC